MRAKQGDRVKVHYTGRFAGGEVFDSSEGGEPLEFEAGGQELIRGVSLAVIGMEVGEKRTITVPPEEGYGQHQEDLLQEVPLDALPDGVKAGDHLQAQSGDDVLRVVVREVGDGTALLDANHPLAGKTIEFDLELVSVEDDAPGS